MVKESTRETNINSASDSINQEKMELPSLGSETRKRSRVSNSSEEEKESRDSLSEEAHFQFQMRSSSSPFEDVEIPLPIYQVRDY